MKQLSEKTKKAIYGVGAALLALLAAVLGLTSCGTTKATISKPAEGTQTTITITTNNPITTNTNPNINFK